jgi:predicted AAA+ superfamily ATPase
MFTRVLTNQVKESLFKGLVIIIYGARQVGKTTMVKDILSYFKPDEAVYFDCDLTRYREALSTQDEIILKNLVAGKKLVVIDEAQRVENIGLTLKILHGYFPQTQFIATGSSSFELANQICEPLTGRSKIFTLYPLSILELKSQYNNLELQSHLQNILVYGLYPNVFDTDSNTAKDRLETLTGGYLYQDLLKLEEIKKPKLMDQLLRLLAFQVGSTVSFSELAQKLSVSTVTVQKYVDLLEKSFIIFSLSGFSRNLRNEIIKSPKIYFYDLGIRNSLINNLNAIELRDDIGALWENFCILERRKYLQYCQFKANTYFWRNYQNQEIDYIEERNGVLNCYEFKFNDRKNPKLPKSFAQAYANHTFEVVNNQNLIDVIFKTN